MGGVIHNIRHTHHSRGLDEIKTFGSQKVNWINSWKFIVVYKSFWWVWQLFCQQFQRIFQKKIWGSKYMFYRYFNKQFYEVLLYINCLFNLVNWRCIYRYVNTILCHCPVFYCYNNIYVIWKIFVNNIEQFTNVSFWN